MPAAPNRTFAGTPPRAPLRRRLLGFGCTELGTARIYGGGEAEGLLGAALAATSLGDSFATSSKARVPETAANATTMPPCQLQAWLVLVRAEGVLAGAVRLAQALTRTPGPCRQCYEKPAHASLSPHARSRPEREPTAQTSRAEEQLGALVGMSVAL